MSCIEEAVEKASQSRRPIVEEGDYNIVDVLHIADMLQTCCNLDLGTPSTALLKDDVAQRWLRSYRKIFILIQTILDREITLDSLNALKNWGRKSLKHFLGLAHLRRPQPSLSSYGLAVFKKWTTIWKNVF
jgi:hypothetical protein